MTEECNDPELQEMMDETEQIHTLWWKLSDYLEGHDKNMDHLAGYEDMQLMDKFCKENPGIIRVHVDDAHHCNSYLYIVPHESEKEYMGSSVIFVPQCCGINNQFFLYPSDVKGLYRALKVLHKKFQEKGDGRFLNSGDLNGDDEDTKD